MTPQDVNRNPDPSIRLKRLHKHCQITLERYMALANETCTLSGKLQAMPVTRDKRIQIMLQRKRENEAHDEYQKARNSLLAMIEGNLEIQSS